MDPLAPSDPQRVGVYTLLGRLGGGGMGQVYLGRSPGGRPVAVKVVHGTIAADRGFRLRFAQEVEAARRVGGFHTAPVVDADPEGDPPWLVTAYVPGPSLHDAVAASGPMPVDTVRSLGAGLAEGLAAIHACGLVHRDLKPANVILADDGPRVIDFGIARAMGGGSELTVTGTMIGTPGFMSPEQARGDAEVGPESDVFSLGSVLAFAATGEGPFGGGSLAGIVYRIVSGQADLARLPDELRDVVTACLAPEPSRRPTLEAVTEGLTRGGDTTDMFTPGWLPATIPALATAAIQAASVVIPPPPNPPLPPRTRVETPGAAEAEAPTVVAGGGGSRPSRRRVLFGAAGLVGAVAAGALGWTLLDGDDKKDGGSENGDAPASSRTGEKRWHFPTTGVVLSYPRIAGGTVYAASNDGTLYALNAQDGTERWHFTTNAAIGSAPAVVGGVVYLGSDDKKLYAIDGATGLLRWAFETGGIVHSPVFSGGLVHVGSADGNLYAVNADGTERWRFPTGNDTHHAVFAGETVYVGCSDTNLYAVDAASGTKKWTVPTGGAVSGFPVVERGNVYFAATDQVLYAAEAATGRPLWKLAGVSPKSGPAVIGGVAYMGGGSKLFAVDALTGAPRGEYATAGDVSAPTVTGGAVYVGSSDQQLHVLDAATLQPRWKFQASAAVQTPAVADDTVYFGTADNSLYAVRI
ncbi:outer membrane protein assembly factor BamB family protein [Yinghuangia sp. YIM S10712]|uniref:outer membrane protein assembly factor BamB family protein n=1 Tax=Yinghuangia sp. YIM S10712 TaxID=3436930 RepID=UPI003F53796B